MFKQHVNAGGRQVRSELLLSPATEQSAQSTLASSVGVRSRRVDEVSLFRRPRTWWLLIALLLIAGQNSWFTEAETQSKQLIDLRHTYDTSSPILQMLTLSFYVICIGLMAGHWGATFRSLVRQKTFLCFLLLASTSVLWSQDPAVTIRQLPRLVIMIFIGWFIGLYYTTEEQIRITLTTGLILVTSSAVMAVALPRYGLDAGGEWKGVMGQKNQLGHAILFLFSGLLFRKERRHNALWIFAGFLAVFVLFMTRSAESLMLAILLVAISWIGPLLKRTRREGLPFLLFALGSGVLAVIAGRSIVLDVFGKDSTLTGRTVEWATIMPFAMQHFWLGYGYNGFWTGSGDSLRVMTLVGGSMHGADSGYLDLFLQFGLVGVVLALTIMLGAAWKSVKLFSVGLIESPAYWYFALVTISIMGNVVDAYFPLIGGAPEIMLIFACASLHKLSRTSNPQRRVYHKGTNSLPLVNGAL